MHIRNINLKAKENTSFRQVLATSEHTQVVIMSIEVAGEIGKEVHPDNDQILYLLSGQGRAILNGVESSFEAGDLVLVPAGLEHNFINIGSEPMKIITSYSPPHHTS